jgi:cytochrome c553
MRRSAETPLRRLGFWVKTILMLLCLLGTLTAVRAAAEPTPAQLDFFENKIRPVLADHCYKCHSTQAEKVKGGLLLDSREGLLKGGDSGPPIVPGDPEASLLIKAVRYTDPDLQMPKDKKLPDDAIADLTAWVKMGAPDPRSATAALKKWNDSRTNHWAWQPVKRQTVPEVGDPVWCQTPVDHFILAKLEAGGLKPNPPADKRTLIRRATFDLIGLPPTPDEVREFVNDESPGAFAKVVDRLLASPHYGERWGRHWLDVARYSDTIGQPRRNQEDPLNPFAWGYRDYVIRSFNENKPYDEFIKEQIAADRLAGTARNPTNLAALGFLTVGDHYQGMQNDIINDRIDVVTKGFLALTVTCARCHDHKFDPIPQKDYYSLHGIFASSVEPKLEPVIGRLPNTPAFHDYYAQREALGRREADLTASLPKLRKSKDTQGVKQAQKELQQVVHQIAELEFTNLAAPLRAMVLEDPVRGHDSPLFIRGEAGNRGELVPRRFLQLLSGPVRPVYTNGSGRLQLALAIASKNNPLTARVMINRIWQHHFGQGFVPTPDDFGTMSDPPSHPELLDYLALNFMTNGWNIKSIHRLILLSSVWQESCENNPRYAQADPGNRLLWRANLRRLEYEPLRDSLLAIGGRLDTNVYGRPVDLRKQPDSTRRTVYELVDRANIDDVLINFDFATPDMVTGIRHQTTVPQQALYLMNSPIVIELAKRLVAMPSFVDSADDAARLDFLYERIYQRPASPEETALGLEFVNQTPLRDDPAPADLAANNPGPNHDKSKQSKRPGAKNNRPRAPLTSWEEYAQALLQANETSFVN